MGIFDESERGRTKVSQPRSRVRTARRSWPISARLLVGTLFVLNILLAAFLVRTEILRPAARPRPPATSTPPTPQQPKAGSTPQLNAPPDQASSPNQASSPDQGSSPAHGPSPDQGSSRALKTPSVEARPAALPSTRPRTRMARRPPIKALPKALRASKTRRAVLPAPMPRAVIYPPQQPPGQTPAPVRNPAASSSASLNVARPGLAASSAIPAAAVPSNPAPHPNAPPASALAPPAIDHGLTAKGTRSGSVARVASVGLPAMEKGLVIPKTPVTSVSPKMEIVPRPPVKLENCGDDKVFVACPKLKIRYDTPYTSEDP